MYEEFLKVPLLGILRGIPAGAIEGIIDAAIAGGMKAIEVTMNTDNAPGIIRAAVKRASGLIAVGAGTVLSMDDLKRAEDAGASFMVMPNYSEEAVSYCVSAGLPVFPGALTPQETYRCWEAGAYMVKLFPASVFGPSYVSHLLGPFGGMKILACGGVKISNISEYFSAGASAVAAGASLFKPELMGKDGHAILEKDIAEYVKTVKDCISRKRRSG